MDNKKERLKKIYNLSLKGVGGEREQAQAILDKLLKKYELSLDDIDDEDTASYDYELKYHGEEQLRILHQTIYMNIFVDKRLQNLKTHLLHYSCQLTYQILLQWKMCHKHSSETDIS